MLGSVIPRTRWMGAHLPLVALETVSAEGRATKKMNRVSDIEGDLAHRTKRSVNGLKADNNAFQG